LAPEPGIQQRNGLYVFYVYLLASRKQGTLYLGVTRDLVRRIYQHREKLTPGFSSRYDIRRLVWFEVYDDPVNAIEREKEIKKWRRAWKIALIEKDNPDWKDLYPEITK
jgi:putative endonuclease